MADNDKILMAIILALPIIGLIMSASIAMNSIRPGTEDQPTYTPTVMPTPKVTITNPSHPFLLFYDISEVTGYRMQNEYPWKKWKRSVIKSADKALSKDFSDQYWPSEEDNWVSARGIYAMNLGLAYQITNKRSYADKAKEALLNIGVGEVPYDPGMMTPEAFKSISLLGYCMAYDWVQPALDSKSDAIIRDKLALLSDSVYYDLNEGGKDLDYITFDDFHGQAYPTMGIAGVTLYDYTNPNGLPLKSTPADWIKVGTDYLFVNDELHSYNRSLISFALDGTGKDLSGSYKSYYLDDFICWAQVYSHYYGRNFLDDYPVVRSMVTSEVWESLPNHYSSNFLTNGNMQYFYHRGIANLLDPANRSYALNHDDLIENSELLPYSDVMDHIYYNTELPDALLYLVYDDYRSTPRAYPAWTSRLDTHSIYQVFRADWSEDSDWLSLITFLDEIKSRGYRLLAHHDQLGFEYYARGDLLLADAGEDRNVLDKYYGRSEVHHNTISIEDPRHPFGPSTWANSVARGIFKGSSSSLRTPAYIQSIVQTPWMEMVDASLTISEVMKTLDTGQRLSSPIEYERTVMYPDKDYFIIIDRFEGAEPWVYRNIFRPASLSITPTRDPGLSDDFYEDDVGNVNGNLVIGNVTIDWLSQPYKEEYDTGISTNSLKWYTVNPYGEQVELQVYTSPASEVIVNKHLGRIAGYSYRSEVFSPVVSFRSLPADDLYRVIVLLPRYMSEDAKEPVEIPVNGNGNALKVTSSGYEDYIYTGKGASSFDKFFTDADSVFVRRSSEGMDYTLINGMCIAYDNAPMITLSSKADYLTLNQQSDKYTIKLKNGDDLYITLSNMRPGNDYQVIKDGVEYSDWNIMDDRTISLHVNSGEHIIEIITAPS